MVENRPQAKSLLNDAQRWGLVIDVQDALSALTEMVDRMDEANVSIPGSIASIMRVISTSLDIPLGIDRG